MSAFRVLTLGGFTALSGTAVAYYFHQLNGDNTTADCKPFQYYEANENSPQFKCKPWNYNWDFREPINVPNEATECGKNDSTDADKMELTTKVKPTATRHVILVRHGQYVHSKEGENFKVLNDLGREQALLTGKRLKSLNINFDRLVISTVVRAQETGKIIGDLLPNVAQEHCSLLCEGSPYPVEPSRPSLETYKWKRHIFVDNPRIEGAFRKYIHRAEPEQEKDSYDVLVCHANVIRYFVCRALQFPPEGWLRIGIANGGITWISIRPNGKVSLLGLGDVGHLPVNLITSPY